MASNFAGIAFFLIFVSWLKLIFVLNLDTKIIEIGQKTKFPFHFIPPYYI
ncbi:hypothetical protein HMPREF0648_1811 [Prevotella bivia JCVIHMP010]|nr:hypothetical protein HMPREF0648_1811 [Prevotella bivia JCVIHMP010]